MSLEKMPKFTPKQLQFLTSFSHISEFSEVNPHDWSAPFIAWFLGWDVMESEWPYGYATADRANEAIDFLHNLAIESERVIDAS